MMQEPRQTPADKTPSTPAKQPPTAAAVDLAKDPGLQGSLQKGLADFAAGNGRVLDERRRP